MNVLVNDSVPLAVRGLLLALVVCLHAVGAAAFSRLSEPLRHSKEPMVLQASWIEGAPSASPLPDIQPTEPLPAARPVSPRKRSAQVPEHRTRSRALASSHPQVAAVQSTSAPVVVETAPAVPDDSGHSDDPVPSPRIDISSAMTATIAGGSVGGEGENRDGEGSRDRDYIGPDFNVSYLSNPKPEYPSRSRRLREQGLVKLRVHVTAEGYADEVTLHTSSGFDLLDKSALDTVRRWRFRPAQRAGTPVEGRVIVPLRFELQD
ncbi:MAG: energy transducer TonB [Betaproteobacteria bacterium]|nr:energy transducer TonB [Betaproteobacteria bacterium]